jgi:hypothetical protein
MGEVSADPNRRHRSTSGRPPTLLARRENGLLGTSDRMPVPTAQAKAEFLRCVLAMRLK